MDDRSRNAPQVAHLMNELSATARDDLLARLSTLEPDLAEQIRDALFTFDDLIYVEGKSLQALLREIDPQLLLKALKGAQSGVKKAIFSQLSRRKVEMIKGELEVMPPIRLSEAHEAQRQIARRAREMSEQGKLVIIRPGAPDQYV